MSNTWEDFYRNDGVWHQTAQNALFRRDFDNALGLDPDGVMHSALESANRIVSIGCGTGGFAYYLSLKFGASVMGVDVSETAVTMARAHYPECQFEVMDFHDIQPGFFDMAFASNLLEHFADWRAVLRRWLEIAPLVLLLVPYRETITADGDDGGRAHLSTFDEDSFTGFRVLDWFTFRTDGWVIGDNPLQMAVLLEADR